MEFVEEVELPILHIDMSVSYFNEMLAYNHSTYEWKVPPGYSGG